MIYDVCIVGGGIVGLATALAVLERSPSAHILILEKERTLGFHQTGHNSGVIHAGIYYAPGSLKARLCKEGAQAIKQFCTENDVPFDVCGKLIVATDGAEHQRLLALSERAQANEIAFEWLDQNALREREPNIDGTAAIFVPSTGIVDYKRVCEAMGRLLVDRGVDIKFGVQVESITETATQVEIAGAGQTWSASQLIACAGLQSDRLARISGIKIDHQVVPFRGEYYRLKRSRDDLVKHLIYPVPDPDLPFLGIHITKMIDGSLTVGPNAVLGMAREGYAKLHFNARDVAEYARFPGLWRVLFKNAGSAFLELRNSLSKQHYLKACQKYCPSLTLSDLEPMEAGIRAQAVMRDGSLVHDFLFLETKRMIHVCNAPSPAATSSIPIGREIAARRFAREIN